MKLLVACKIPLDTVVIRLFLTVPLFSQSVTFCHCLYKWEYSKFIVVHVSLRTKTTIQVSICCYMHRFGSDYQLVKIRLTLDLPFFRNMFDEKRRETSIVYLSCLLVTVIVVFIPIPVDYSAVKLLLLVLLLIAQFCASLWYTLSYIPYGRRTFLRMIKGAFGIEDEGQKK